MSKPIRQPDFTEVQGGVTSKAAQPTQRVDFSDVRSRVGVGADEATIHTVAAGDNLSTIARQFYGSANAWKTIFDANRDQLTDPDRIKPGQILKIPAKS